MQIEQKSSAVKSQRQKIILWAVVVLAASALFFSGWGLGSGRLRFNSYRPSVSNNNVTELDFTSVQELYAELKDNFDGDLDIDKLIDGLKEGLAKASGDPYTEYFNAAASQEFEESLSGSFGGIGAELGKEGQSIVVIAPIAGTPAERAGIKSKDIIAAIDDEPSVDLTVSEAVEKIRGEPGTKVKLTVIRNDTERHDFEITREQINIPSVTWKIENGVGIITVARFWDDTAKLARDAATEFKTAGITNVVLDLRGNPGGSLDAAVQLSSLWLDKGEVVLREKRGDKVVSTLTATGNPVFKTSKTVVLINEGSASASEIVAGALKDQEVAKVIGVTSYGKGSVQQLIELNSGGALKVTIARWYTPKDKNIDKEGISPDIEVKRTTEDFEARRDPQLEAAFNELR